MKPSLPITLAVLSLTACTSDKICFTRSPPYPLTSLRTFSRAQVLKEASLLAPNAKVFLSDNSYTLVSYDWLQVSLPVWRTILSEAGYTYSSNITDCENFSTILSEWIFYKAKLAGVKQTPLSGTIFVKRPSGNHAMIAVATDRGIFIIEPQPSGLALVSLTEFTYPVYEISFGR